MFTGIIEETGTVERVSHGQSGIRLAVRAARSVRDLKKGDSLAVNGCCLTAVRLSSRAKGKLVEFDLLEETWKRTNLQFVSPGSLVNLERPLTAKDRFGGHFVTGHIDGLGKITRWIRQGQDWVLDIAASPDLMRYIIFKGSIAVDGISLTIAEARKRDFRLWIIPHTYEVTALRERKTGDAVNLETDLLGKYAERFLTSIAAAR